MARIDELVDQVPSPSLRRELKHAISELRSRQNFGLVFEEHIPEVTALLGFPLAVGQLVQLRTDPEDGLYRIKSLSARKADVAPEAGGEPARVNRNDVLVVKRFGEPIYPVLTSLHSVRRTENRAAHAVINGENFHALQLLVHLHEGEVDCAYLDPPYNTGARDWKYNNRFVDLNDSWRHSKWLSMMEKRLKLVRRLLKPDGVLIVTIDEHEVHHLGMLLERIFPEADRQMVTIVINPKGVTRPGTVRFSRVEEYAVFCFLGDSGVVGRGDDLLTSNVSEDDPTTTVGQRPRWKGLLRSGTNARREDRPNMFYPVLVDQARRAAVGVGEPLHGADPDLSAEVDGHAAAWPIRSDGSFGNWGVGHTTLRELISQGFVAVGDFDSRRHTWPLSYLSEELRAQLEAGVLDVVSRDEERNVVDVRYTEESARRLKTVWHRTRHDAGVGGADILRAFVGSERVFDFPKSVYAVRDCLAAVTRNRPHALIADVFAGSGTTLHATCLLNAQDGGHRRTILVTNNELVESAARQLNARGVWRGDPEFEAAGIFERVTRPRCEAVVTGRRSDGTTVPGAHLGGRPYSNGFDENIEFFRLDYVDPQVVELGAQFDAMHPLLWLAGGAVGAAPATGHEPSGWFVGEANAYAVLFDDASFDNFRRDIEKLVGLNRVFLVTDSEEAFAEMRSDLPDNLKTSMLYRDYLRSFQINAQLAR
jgi:adenine-specific DNA-methyltransferase